MRIAQQPALVCSFREPLYRPRFRPAWPINPESSLGAHLRRQGTHDDYLKLGIEEWKKSYAENEPLGKKAVLFVMVDDTRNCDDVGAYLEPLLEPHPTPRIAGYLSRTQVKFTASSVLPVPVYRATCGYGQRGRVRSTWFPAETCDAAIRSGALPCSTHCSRAATVSKREGPSPPLQWVMAGAMKRRSDGVILSTPPPFAAPGWS